jgi:hypothetical protein
VQNYEFKVAFAEIPYVCEVQEALNGQRIAARFALLAFLLGANFDFIDFVLVDPEVADKAFLTEPLFFLGAARASEDGQKQSFSQFGGQGVAELDFNDVGHLVVRGLQLR